MSLFFIPTCATLLISLIFSTQCSVDGCNYLYQKVPTNTTCNIREGRSASFGCDAIGICNTFSVLWFKDTNEASIRTNSSERISQSDGPNKKYQILNHGPLAAANGHCIIGTALIINRFNHSDSGYYWCQIVPNNNCPLLPSPHEYVAVGEIMNDHPCKFERQLPFPICAEDARSLTSEEMGCVSTVKIVPTIVAIRGPYSTHNYKINSTTATSMTSIHDNNGHDNMVWLYGLMAAFLSVIIILVLSLVLVSIKYKIQPKQKSSNHCKKVRLDTITGKEEVSNPHYIKTSFADINVGTNEEVMDIIQRQTGQNEGGHAQSAVTADEANRGDMHAFANCNQEKVAEQSPEYAAVNRAKHSLNNSIEITTGGEWYSPGYAEVGNLEVANKTVVTNEVQENPSAYVEPLKRSPSPVYAEVHKDKKKRKQQEDHSVVVEERERSQSPEYTEVDKVNKHSGDIVNQVKQEHEQHYNVYHTLENPEEHRHGGNQEDEQHYYYSLEIPEEHACSGNNIEETVYTSEDSQEPKVIKTQSMLCEAPYTNTHTKFAEINTFPNPCYRTKMAATD